MEATAVGAASNGAVPESPREQIALQLEALIDQTQARHDELRAELDEISRDLNSYQIALGRLRGQPKYAPKHAKTKAAATKDPTRGTMIGDERLNEIERAIRVYARDHDEFRQVDIRGIYDMTSSVAATAFEKLRQRQFIRLARKDGNQKWFRLTSEALRQQEAEAS